MTDSLFYKGLGIDLIKAARNELSFLKQIDEYPYLNTGPVLKNAIRRYEAFWLPLASNEQANKGKESKNGFLAAPLDIAWVWHVHMLAPYHYEQDCLRIVSKVIDHKPLSNDQREGGLRTAKRIWNKLYPMEPFEVDLSQFPAELTEYKSKIQYNLEHACYRQSKFYYQVSLPHYNDDKFLRKAMERYGYHLQLTKQHPEIFMVPCYDVDLMWHTHQLHPLNYKETTTALLGKTLHHDDEETDRNPGSKLYDSEMKTRAVWEAAGLRFSKPGAMYRGDPPDSIPPRPKWLYASLARSEYEVDIQKIEAKNFDAKKNFEIRLQNTNNITIFSQEFKGDNVVKISNSREFTFDNESRFTLKVFLYKTNLFFFKTLKSVTEVSLLPYLEATPFDDTVSQQQVTIDVPFTHNQYTAKLTVGISTPTITKYSFTVDPEKKFTACNHPRDILSAPQLMLSPNDLAQPFLPCESSTHSVLDWKDNEVFKCRVTHSSFAMLSSVEIISLYDEVVATAHTVSLSTLPERRDIQDETKSIRLEQMEGERAMLVRGQTDWAICTGKWQQELVKGKNQTKKHHFVKIKIYKLFGKRGWCAVRKSKGGLFLIKFDSNTLVRLDLKQSKIVISPGAHDIPEILALSFSVSILYLLCMPYTPQPSQDSSPASQLSSLEEISPMFFLAGFLCTTVPTNVYLETRLGREFCYVSGDAGDVPCYDFNDDMACDVNEGPSCEGDDCSAFDDTAIDGGTGGGGCVGGDCDGGGGGGGCVGGDRGGDGGGCGSGGGCGGGGGCGAWGGEGGEWGGWRSTGDRWGGWSGIGGGCSGWGGVGSGYVSWGGGGGGCGCGGGCAGDGGCGG